MYVAAGQRGVASALALAVQALWMLTLAFLADAALY